MKSKSQPTSEKRGDKPVNERGGKKGKAWCRRIKRGKEKGKTTHHLYKSKLHKREYERNILHIDPCLLVSALLRLARRQEHLLEQCVCNLISWRKCIMKPD
jgi:hypothetical protein